MDRVAACRPARPSATSRTQISPGLATARRSPASSTASSSTCRIPLDRDAAVRIVTDRSPEALALYRHSTAHLLAAAVTQPVPGHAVRHRPGHRRRLLLRLRRRAAVRAGGPRRHRAEDEGAGVAGSGLRAPDVAARGSQGVFRQARRAAQGAADRREDRRPGRGLLLHDQGQGHLHRLLRRPARAVDRQAEGVQAAVARRTPTGRATRATSRCSASTARRSSPTRI